MIDSYINQLKANGKSEKTIESYRYVLNRLNRFKKLEQMTKNDLVEFFGNFEGKQQTKRLFQGIVKKFYQQNGKSEIVDWIQLVKIKIVHSEDDENTLLVEDINKMIEATDSPYWKAYIASLFECGSRFSEHKAAKWKDFENNILKIGTTKTDFGIRRIPLIMSGVYLENLQISKESGSTLKTDEIFHYSEEWTLQNLKEIGKSAGIIKPCNPHRFRHARATDLVRRGTQETIIRKILGWTPDSTMIARYTHTNKNSIIEAMTGVEEIKVIPEITSSGNMVDNLKVQIHQNEEDIQILLQEIENMKKTNIEFQKYMKEKYGVKQ